MTETTTNYHHEQAVRAIQSTGLKMVTPTFAAGQVNAPGEPDVFLTATIVVGDETVVLRWQTDNGSEVSRPLALAIDRNLPHLLAAVAGCTVNAYTR